MVFSPYWSISDCWNPMHHHDVLYAPDGILQHATVEKNNGESGERDLFPDDVSGLEEEGI
ncbi:hypothetical protein KSK55_01620 [Methanospirillum purgamenti]|jgi:hypothetical protein|uniref:Uncharacterized protein n=1 Tax=Methanospirillum hungatei TaxID=2203 RepID=A0A8F5ZG19_METHU|nr:hypothetical protein [Methanospirillum hungatei]QXO95139.1 hypothetical protein KSK55_01620 [Methanospirillum hungatei]